MKVTVQSSKSSAIVFPCLMVAGNGEYNTGLIVYMWGPGSGVILRGVGSYVGKEGETSKAWAMDQFQPLEGSITLSNE